MRVRAFGLVALFVAALVLTGCGGAAGVSVSGKVMNGGSPYVPSKDGDMNITLGSESGKDSGTGKVEEDGTFKVTTSKGGGLPPGKYKVTATRYPSKAEMKPGSQPTPKNLSLSEQWDVSASSNTFTLDASKLK